MAKDKKKKGRKAQRGFLRNVLKFSVIAGLLGAIAVSLIVVFYAFTLPDIGHLSDEHFMPSVTLLSADDKVIATYGDQRGDYMPYSKIPRPLVNAVVATEDRRFFSHHGIDLRGVARAVVTNITAGRLVQGGSTVTQQLAKIVFLRPERSLGRKVQEALLALWIEKRYSKEQIMEIYLNRVYLGAGTYGVDAASERYFNKPASALNLYESAMLAGLLKAPSKYSPSANPELARKRTAQVLANMEAAGMITKERRKSARESGVFAAAGEGSSQGGYYFGDYVMNQIPEFIGFAAEDIVIKTTLRADLQKSSEEAVERGLAMGEKSGAGQAALVSLAPDGAVLAMVGGKDYRKSQFNRATQAERQPGSAFKLFVYLAAMNHGLNPDSVIEDAPIKLGKWQPRNYDGKYYGEVSLREAFMRSLNAATVRLSESVGRGNVIETARALGIKSDLPADGSVALGSGAVNLMEMTGAYAHLAAGGKTVAPYSVTEIVTRKGEVLYSHEAPAQYQAVSANSAAMMNDLLVNVISGGTGRAASIGRPAAGKTGTSQDFRDAWFIGFTPDMITGVWVGNDGNEPMKKVAGGGIPARIWRDYMSVALAGVPPKDIPSTPSPEITGLPWSDEGESTAGLDGLEEELRGVLR